MSAAAAPPSKPDDASPYPDDAKRRGRSLRPLLVFAPELLRHRKHLALALVALIVSALAMLAVPVAVRRMIDLGFSGSDGTFIDRYFMMLIAIGAVLAAASSARFYFVNWLGERVVADVRTKVFAHLSSLSPAFFEKTHSAEVMSRLSADTALIKAAAGTALSQALRNLIMLIGAGTMMVVTSPMLSALVLIAIPLIVFPLMAYGRVVRKLSRQAQDTLAEASTYAAENLAAVRTMQAYTHEANARRRFTEAAEQAFEAARRRLLARAGLTAMVILLVVSSIVGVLWIGASAVVQQEMTGGRLGQFVLYALFAGGALAELSEVWGEVQQAAGAAERLAELLDAKPVVTSPVNPRPMRGPARGEVTVEHVTFTYPERSAPALDDVSFKVRPGETVAIVGPSGGGKSTILALLLRFWDPHKGSIAIDGTDLRHVDLKDLRQRIALVPQDIALFADTVLENIRYGAPDASREAVECAARLAQADGFIRAMPQGYETRLGERGVQLSGGQRQRIAIARAILRDAPLLLLDEATSALDAESETDVQKALEAVMHARTTIVVAHRLATIRKADRILVFDAGRLVESGTHAELSRAGGLYARLAQLQFTPEATVR